MTKTRNQSKLGAFNPTLPKWSKLGSEFLVSLGVCTLLSSAFLGMTTDAKNLLDLFWRHADTLALFFVIFLNAVLVLLGYKFLNWLTHGRLAAKFKPIVFLIFSLAIIQFLSPSLWTSNPLEANIIATNIIYGSILILGMVGTAIAAIKRTDKLTRILWRSIQGLSVLYPILFFNAVQTNFFILRDDLNQFVSTAHPVKSPSVVIMSFDSISMRQCLNESGEWHSNLPAMKAFRANSVCLDQAVSCGPGTTTSVPNFLFQRSPEIYNHDRLDNSMLSQDPNGFTNGVFYMAKQFGYRTGMLGIYHPFGHMFGALLDGVKDVTGFRFWIPLSFWGRCINAACCILTYARGPFNGSLVLGVPKLRHVPGRLTNNNHVRNVRLMTQTAHETLQSMPPFGHLFYSHMVTSHSPFVFLSDGTVDPSPATYYSQLQYTDLVFGGLMQKMKDTGIYEKSWVILTSDHGSLKVLDFEKQRRHVPFVVKPPNSEFAQIVDAPLNLWEISEFFRAIFSGKTTEECLSALSGAIVLE